jgi:hypothetical protein
MDTWSNRKNEPKRTQTNPKRTQFSRLQRPNEPKSCPPSVWRIKKAKMNVSSIITKTYENISNWAICENKPNSNPIQSQYKPNLSRRSLWRSRNKPNRTQLFFRLLYDLWGQLIGYKFSKFLAFFPCRAAGRSILLCCYHRWGKVAKGENMIQSLKEVSRFLFGINKVRRSKKSPGRIIR